MKVFSLFGSSDCNSELPVLRQDVINKFNTSLVDRLEHVGRDELLDIIQVVRKAIPTVDKYIRPVLEATHIAKLGHAKAVGSLNGDGSRQQETSLGAGSNSTTLQFGTSQAIQEKLNAQKQELSQVSSELKVLDDFFKGNSTVALESTFKTTILHNIYQAHIDIVSRLTNQIKNLQSQVQNATHSAHSSSSTPDLTQTKLEEQRKSYETILSELKTRLSTQENEISASKSQVDALTATLEQVKHEAEQFKTKFEKEASDKSRLANGFATLKEKDSQKETQITKLKAELAHATESHQKDIAVFKQSTSDLEAKLMNLEASVQEEQSKQQAKAQEAENRNPTDQILGVGTCFSCGNLQAQLGTAKSETQKLNLKLEAIKAQKEILKAKCTELDKKLLDLQEAHTSNPIVSPELTGLQESLSQAQHTIETLQKQLSEQTHDSETAKHTISQLHEHKESLTNELAGNRAAAHHANTEVSTLSAELAKVQEKLRTEIVQRKEERETHIKAAESKSIAAVESATTALKHQITELTKLHQEGILRNQEIQAQVESIKADLEKSKLAEKAARSETETVNSHLVRVEEELRAKSASSAKLNETQIEHSEAQVQVQSALATLKKLLADAVKAKDDAIFTSSEFEALNRQQKTELDRLVHENEQATRTASSASSELSKAQEKMKELHNQANHLKNQVQNTNNQLEQAKAQLADAQRELATANEQIEAEKSRKAALEHKLGKLHDDANKSTLVAIEEIKQTLSAAIHERDELRNQAFQLHQQVTQLSEQHKHAVQKNFELANQIQALSHGNSEIEALKSTHEQEIKQLKDNAKEAKVSLVNSKLEAKQNMEKLNKALAELELAKSEIEDLRGQLGKLQSELGAHQDTNSRSDNQTDQFEAKIRTLEHSFEAERTAHKADKRNLEQTTKLIRAREDEARVLSDQIKKLESDLATEQHAHAATKRSLSSEQEAAKHSTLNLEKKSAQEAELKKAVIHAETQLKHTRSHLTEIIQHLLDHIGIKTVEVSDPITLNVVKHAIEQVNIVLPQHASSNQSIHKQISETEEKFKNANAEVKKLKAQIKVLELQAKSGSDIATPTAKPLTQPTASEVVPAGPSKESIAELKALKARVKILEMESKKKDEELEKLREEEGSSKDKIDHLKLLIQQGKDELASKKKQLTAEKKTIKALEKKLGTGTDRFYVAQPEEEDEEVVEESQATGKRQRLREIDGTVIARQLEYPIPGSEHLGVRTRSRAPKEDSDDKVSEKSFGKKRSFQRATEDIEETGYEEQDAQATIRSLKNMLTSKNHLLQKCRRQLEVLLEKVRRLSKSVHDSGKMVVALSDKTSFAKNKRFISVFAKLIEKFVTKKNNLQVTAISHKSGGSRGSDSFSEDSEVLKYSFEDLISYVERKEHETGEANLSQGLLLHNLNCRWNRPAGILIEEEGAQPHSVTGVNEVVPPGPERNIYRNLATTLPHHSRQTAKKSIYKRIVTRKTREAEAISQRGSRSRSSKRSQSRPTALGKRKRSIHQDQEVSEPNNQPKKIKPQKTPTRVKTSVEEEKHIERSLFNLTDQDPEPIIYSRKKDPQGKRSIGRVVRESDESSKSGAKQDVTVDREKSSRRKKNH